MKYKRKEIISDCTLYHGDCLEAMKVIPDGSIDMILCDPPYGTVKGIGSENVSHGMVGKTEWDTVLNTTDLFEQYNRILRVNGTCILFSQEPYTSHLITSAHKDVPFSYRMIWKKDHFANALVAKKAPVSYYEDINVFAKTWDHLLVHPLRKYARKVLESAGKNLKDVNKILGHRRAEHFLYWNTSQFSLPTEETYNELELLCRSPQWWKPYEWLLDIDSRYRRVFNLPEGQKYMSNVLEFKKDYGGLHPTQKPVALFEYLIKTYTNPGETVLDNCMGSGTTGVACKNLNRKFIGIEKDDKYFEIACKRINDHVPKQEVLL